MKAINYKDLNTDETFVGVWFVDNQREEASIALFKVYNDEGGSVELSMSNGYESWFPVEDDVDTWNNFTAYIPTTKE